MCKPPETTATSCNCEDISISGIATSIRKFLGLHCAIDPDLATKTALVEIDEKQLAAEKELVNKYQKFSAELLRLSLLGIPIVVFVFENDNTIRTFGQKNGYIAFSVMFFGISAAFAIAHRYFSSETLRFFVWALRYEAASAKAINAKAKKTLLKKAKICLKRREHQVEKCMICKAFSAGCLAFGALLLAFAFGWSLLWYRDDSHKSATTSPPAAHTAPAPSVEPPPHHPAAPSGS